MSLNGAKAKKEIKSKCHERICYTKQKKYLTVISVPSFNSQTTSEDKSINESMAILQTARLEQNKTNHTCCLQFLV